MSYHIISKSIKAIALATAIFLYGWSIVAAQEAPPPTEIKASDADEAIFSPPSLEQIKTFRTGAESSTDLSESDKKSILSYLDQGIRYLEEVDRLNAETVKLNQKLASAPERVKEIEIQLSRKAPPPDQPVDPAAASRMTNAELEQREREERASLATLRDSLRNVQEQIEALDNRPIQLQKESAEAMRQMQEVRKQLNADGPASGESPMVTEARRTKLLLEHSMLKTQIQAIEHQLLNQKAIATLLLAERDLVKFELSRNEARVQFWQSIAQQRRQQDAIQSRMDAEVARNLAPDLPLLVKEQYEINIKLGKELEELTESEAGTARELDKLQSNLKELEEEFAQLQQRVQDLSLSETIGLALRQRRRELPGPQQYRRSSAKRQLILSQLGEAQFILDDEQDELEDLDDETERILLSLSPVSEEVAAPLRDRIRKLLMDRRDLLDKLENTYRRYSQNLQSLEFTEQRISLVIEAYIDFLDGRLLWMRSSKIFGPIDLHHLPSALWWFGNPNE